MANQFINAQKIVREALMIIRSTSSLISKVNGEYSKEYDGKGVKHGDTIYIKKPTKFRVRKGRTFDGQEIKEERVPLKVEQLGCDFPVYDSELRLNITDFSKDILKPAIAPVVTELDRIIALQALKFSNAVGTKGMPLSSKAVLDAGAFLDEQGCPESMRCFGISPLTQANMIETLRSTFNDQKKVGEQYKSGNMGMNTLGFDWTMSQNLPNFTPGAAAANDATPTAFGAVAVDGANQTGNVLKVKSATGGMVIKAGTRFRFGDTSKILNPQSKQPQELNQWFVVTEDTVVAGAGTADLPIYPAIQPQMVGGKLNAFGTVLASPADSQALTFAQAGNVNAVLNMAFHEKAIGYATVQLPKPNGVDMVDQVVDEKSGISVRYIRDYDVRGDERLSRLDVLFGATCFYPEWGVAAIQ